MRPRIDDEILEDLKDWPVRNIYVERGVKLIEQLYQRVAELEQQLIEVRRAERERCILAITHAWHKDPCYLRDLTDAIQAME